MLPTSLMVFFWIGFVSTHRKLGLFGTWVPNEWMMTFKVWINTSREKEEQRKAQG